MSEVKMLRILWTEFKRMVRERTWLYLTLISIGYIMICEVFEFLRYKLDLQYGIDMDGGKSALELWQFTVDSYYMNVLTYMVGPLVYVLSYIKDCKGNIDSYICVKSQSDFYYISKYIVTIVGGMIVNFLIVSFIYPVIYKILANPVYGFHDLDVEHTNIG